MNNLDKDKLLAKVIKMNRTFKYEEIDDIEYEIIVHSRFMNTAISTITALANTHSGLLIFGIGARANILIEKYNQEEFIKDLEYNIGQIVPKIKYRIVPYIYKKYKPVFLFVEMLNILDMPCHLENKVDSKALMRANGTNVPINPVYLSNLHNLKDFGQINESVVVHKYRKKHSELSLFDQFYKQYIKLHKDIKITKGELKQALNYNTKSITLGYVMSISIYPQLYYPYLNIELYNDKTGELKIFDGSIYRMLINTITYIKKEYGYKIVISKKGIYRTKFCFQIGVLAEFIYNALIHRDYSAYSYQIPIRITLKKSSIQITNPGYSFIDGNILSSDTKLVANKTIKWFNDIIVHKIFPKHGFKYIRKACLLFNMPKPIVTNVDGFFSVQLFKQNTRTIYKEPYTIENILLFCMHERSKLELYQHFFMTNKKDYQYFYQKYIKKLVDQGFLFFTKPHAPRSKNQKLITSKEVLSLLE